jgi:DNA modification methylase
MVECLNQNDGDNWSVYHGDSTDVLAQFPDNCFDQAIYSPPFVQLFVYSDSAADMGNCASRENFFEQYRFLCAQLFRVLKPGRSALVHCSDIPLKKGVDGELGLYRFSDEIAQTHEDAGFITDQRTVIWRCPVVEATRTKSVRLLQKQVRKDSAISSTGMPDYLFKFRKPGENASLIVQSLDQLPIELWREWASPVWMEIRQTHVLGGWRDAKDQCDERHICPLQLDTIRRAVLLWSNPGDVVLDPFGGIGSTGHVALQENRKYVGVELKESYFRQQCANLAAVSDQTRLAI